ncbi:hypothetical protein TELCIR_22458, partial [Teladorsagia circumcincta]
MKRPEFTELELKRAREERRERRGLRGMLRSIRAFSDKSSGSGDGEVEQQSDAHRGNEEAAAGSADDRSGLSKEATQAIEAIEYITRHLTRDNDYKR